MRDRRHGPWVALALVLLPVVASGDVLSDHLASRGLPPVEYVLSKVDDHRIVILGEGHWGRRDAELVRDVVPGLRSRGVALAVEWLPFGSQERLDALVASPSWSTEAATALLREADWPYVQYREILKSAWDANRAPAAAPPLRVLAIGLPEDFRARKLDYDATMAQRVQEYVADGRSRVLVHCGMHHAFTRYLQVERSAKGRVTEFMDRFGNILWRRFGQEVFLVALHKPMWCGPESDPAAKSCPPLDGAVDCAGAALGRAVGFDVAGSPFAELKLPASCYYALGHPYLRLVDYADGYVWSGPVDELPRVDRIPLAEVSPADAADPEKARKWDEESAAFANALARPAMRALGSWRDACPVRAPQLSAPRPGAAGR